MQYSWLRPVIYLVQEVVPLVVQLDLREQLLTDYPSKNLYNSNRHFTHSHIIDSQGSELRHRKDRNELIQVKNDLRNDIIAETYVK